ncbi:MAG: DUF4398 domain-containing protein [Pseudomonas sp.]|uniref:DUF4398 domain-containing protein n=1 Tax=Pseudomonas sp. TaxID=306 RepID=UPI0027373A43|nr:DUF4398 domain-containing protein [Pseudomonas sp.]MDP3846793.1 DUF4398 domain-containing protein [Pseudomonas sp.]
MLKIQPSKSASWPNPSSWRLAGLGAAVLLLAACAAAPQPPTAELQAAEQAIASAEQARVADYASPELTAARDKLTAANSAVQIKEMDMGRRLAEQSLVDAELALAVSQATKAKLVNDDMQKSTNSLQQEMQRNTGAPQ